MPFSTQIDALSQSLERLVECEMGIEDAPDSMECVNTQRQILAGLRVWADRHERMFKACLDATVLLSDPHFNDTNRNDLLSTMRDIVKDIPMETHHVDRTCPGSTNGH